MAAAEAGIEGAPQASDRLNSLALFVWFVWFVDQYF